MRLHHIGYAVADIRHYLEDFIVPLLQPTGISPVVADPIQQVRVCFVDLPGGSRIELVQPLGDRGPVGAIIGSARGGLYHLCYEVEDLDAAVKQLRGHRCMPLGKPVPATAFEGRRILFMMTPQRDLIELVEAAPSEAPRTVG
jgi:methylmalonyl-CoA/ethylmalonyl-CoA epimerase